MDATADTITLIAGPSPELLAALLVLVTAAAGIAVGIMMARRGQVEAWSLVGVFGLVGLGAVIVVAHLPTRLVLDRDGAELAFWLAHDRRAWSDITAVDVRRTPLGTFVAFSIDGRRASTLSLWSRWPGLYVPHPPIEPREISMRVDAWRIAAAR